MRIGIMSFAHLHAYAHADVLNQLAGVEFAGIADEDAERGRLLPVNLGTRYFNSFEELLKADIDGVIITC